MDAKAMLLIAKECAESAVKAFSVAVTCGVIKETIEKAKELATKIPKK